MCACTFTCIFARLYVLASTSFRLNITDAPQPEFKRIPSSRSLGGSSAQLQPCPPPPSASPSPWAQFGVKHLKPLVAFVLQQRHNIAAAALGARRVLLLQSAAYSGEAANRLPRRPGAFLPPRFYKPGGAAAAFAPPAPPSPPRAACSGEAAKLLPRRPGAFEAVR